MLSTIAEFAQIDEKTVLFDVCCGTGAIGICLSKTAKKVIGIELIESAVENAKINLKLNGLDETKCEFHAGRAEELLPNIVREYSTKGLKIVAIVDPPRSGLHKDVLKALRTCKGLDRLVYVSCNP
jgi:tRNA (uracil-5-)-methyltransferase